MRPYSANKQSSSSKRKYANLSLPHNPLSASTFESSPGKTNKSVTFANKVRVREYGP